MDFDLRLAINCAEHFSTASGLGCVLMDKQGTVLHGCGHNYLQCSICTLAHQERERCFSAHRYGMQEAERFGGKYIYYCAMGLTFFTSPILGSNGAEAQITTGPFVMGDEQDYIAYDLNRIASRQPEQTELILEEVRKLPFVETHKVNALSELLFMAVAFMNNVSEANRMMETGEALQIQGQISDYLFHIKLDADTQPYPFREEKRFLQALSRGDQEQTQELLNKLLGHILFQTGGELAQIYDRVYELLILISRTVIESGCDPDYMEKCLADYRQRTQQMQNVEELCLWLSHVIRTLIDSLFSHPHDRHSDLVYRTIQYLQSHYSHKVTLEEVARIVYISPTYLSRIFKREVGCSMVDFLNQIRIEKSKELLADESVSLIKVALQSGFESQSYFNRMFKQLCGVTPQKYRKSLAQQTGYASQQQP